MTKAMISILSLFFINSAFAANFMVVEGRLIDSTGAPIDEASVAIHLDVYSPGAEECLLYSESHSVNMSTSDGYFNVNLGQGTRSGSNYHNISSLLNVLNNTFNNSGVTTCASGSSYNPSANHSRMVRISYNNGGGIQTLNQEIEIGASQYANYAYSLQGYSAADFLRVNTTSGQNLSQTNLQTVFNSANWPTLQGLLDGTSAYFNQTPAATVDNGGQRITNIATPSGGSDATNKTYVDNNLVGMAVDFVDVQSATVNEVLSWNGSQWVAQAISATDGTKLPLSGGTMTGAINMSNQMISNAGDLSVNNNITVGNNLTVSGGISTTNGFSTSGVLQLNSDNSNYVSFEAPNGLAANVVYTLPGDDGTANQVLQTNGSGVLSWATASGGADNLGDHTATAILDLSSYEIQNIAGGTASAPGISFSADANTGIFSPSPDSLSFSTAGLEALTINNAGDIGIGTTMPAYPLQVVGSMAVGGGSLMLKPVGPSVGQGGKILFSELAANGTDTVGFRAPDSLAGPIIWTLPNSDGSAGQVLQTNGSGVLGWITPAAPSSNAIAFSGGGLAAGDVQAAIIELSANKLSTAAGAVDAANINANAVTNAKIAAGTIALDRLNATGGSTAGYVLTSQGSNTMAWMPQGGNFVSSVGAAASPSINFSGDTTTGLFSAGAGAIGFSAGGVQTLRVSSTGIDTNAVSSNAGSDLSFASMQNVTITADRDNNSTGNIVFARGTGPTPLATILNSGNMGIGTTNPVDTMEVVRSQNMATTLMTRNLNTGSMASSQMMVEGYNNKLGTFGVANAGSPMAMANRVYMHASANTTGLSLITDGGDIRMFTDGGATESVVVSSTGNLGVGTNTPAERLQVEGHVRVAGGLLLGSVGTCNAGQTNKIQRNGQKLELCDGTAWKVIAGKTCEGTFTPVLYGDAIICMKRLDNASSMQTSSAMCATAPNMHAMVCDLNQVKLAISQSSAVLTANTFGTSNMSGINTYYTITNTGTISTVADNAASQSFFCCY